MLAVALTAVACWETGTIPVFLAVCTLATGPTVGACWSGPRSGGGCGSFFRGGLLGGLLQATLLSALSIGVVLIVWGRPVNDEAIDRAFLFVSMVFAVSLIEGTFIGPVAWLIYAWPVPGSTRHS